MSWLRPVQAQVSPFATAVLDVLRWSAAAVVVLAHIRNRVLAQPGKLDPGFSDPLSICLSGWGFLSGLSREAVMVFFVVSGFLVGGNVLNSLRSEGDVPLRPYLLRRVNRLYVVLIPALLVGYTLDRLGIGLFGSHPIYAEATTNLGIGQLLGNATFLQTIATTTLGSNGALWSLANEWWYYVMFPLFLGVFMFRRGWAYRLLLLLLGVAAALMVGTDILLYACVWLLGAAARLVCLPSCVTYRTAASQFVCFLVLDRLLIRHWYREVAWFDWLSCMLIGLSCAILLAAMNATSASPPRWMRWRWHSLAASASYSSYLSHMPLLAILIAAIEACGFAAYRPEQPGVAHLMLALGLLVASLLWTALFYVLFERHAKATLSWITTTR